MNFAKFLITIFLTEHLRLLLTLTSLFPGKLLSVKIHGQTLIKQPSLFQNNGIKQRHVGTRRKVELAVNYDVVTKTKQLKNTEISIFTRF